MKKLAIIFLIAVLVPSLVLAWLALRSLRDQQFVLERQQTLLYQGITDAVAREVQNRIAEEQHRFVDEVNSLLGRSDPNLLARTFDEQIRSQWSLAKVGFTVTLHGQLLSPSPASSPEAQFFCTANSGFLMNKETAEVYFNNFSPKSAMQVAQSAAFEASNSANTKERQVLPQQQMAPMQNLNNVRTEQQQQFSKFTPSETEFRQLIGNDSEGMIARFLENKLNLLVWHRPQQMPNLVFGAQVDLERLTRELEAVVRLDPALQSEICVALLNDGAKPVVLSLAGFTTHWKRPFVATEIGEELPHWEVAAYLLNPEQLSKAAQVANITLGLLILMLVSSIGVGGWLIVQDINRQLALARQKTDFVSNVSHELKTPLTSIRMFSELLAEGRVPDPAKQKSYLNIISAEASRLTRLINNVLDFARMERGEKKYQMQLCDLVEVVRETCETFRPHLEEGGFAFRCLLPDAPVCLNADRDAISQVIVNLLSNAEKYSEERKEIDLELEHKGQGTSIVELRVYDRGPGVPKGCEGKIFEQFFRAHDALNSGTQGSGLGLTLARQIARAHGGDLVYRSREDGGSCFVLSLPLSA
ncbi:MAG: sensor histidine kinase [Limisphaerales bacterium]